MIKKDAIIWLLKRLTMCYAFIGLMLLLLWNPLDQFLSTVFPDPGTDDLSLSYVIERLPVHFFLLFTIMIIFVLLSFYWRRYSYFGMAFLSANLVFYTLMRSNYEFYYWMITGPKPGYGGLEGAAEIFFIVIVLGAWLLIDSLLLWHKQMRNITTIVGILVTLFIGNSHLGPVIRQVIKSGW